MKIAVSKNIRIHSTKKELYSYIEYTSKNILSGPIENFSSRTNIRTHTHTKKGPRSINQALSCIPKSVFLFGGAPKMCSSQNDGRFFKFDIAIFGVLFLRDLEPGNYLFPLHDNHVMFHSCLITVVCVSSFFILIKIILLQQN